MDGWIKTYRKLTEWEWYKNSAMVHLFIHLLINASHKDIMWRGIVIKRGQLVASRRGLSGETGISEQIIRTCLERLQSTHEITIKSTHRNSIVTICNYEYYQAAENENNPRINPQNPHEITHYQPSIKQEGKEDKNIISNSYELLCKVGEQPHPEKIDYDSLINFFNSETKGVFGQVRHPISNNRKKLISARVKEHGKKSLVEVITRAAGSNFLRGQNNRGWTATFDWIIKPSNFEKILSGNYDNRNKENSGNEPAELAKNVAAGIARAKYERDKSISG